ncbi:kinase-like protein [Athelia psychrophila]|uniref:Kinase-like protein n=1 Tax=Athelia psychrophila TaxID=1759441 RepID=A0A166DG15_9AGAM|nr:kinase-like protein [Fibularhizoctonia sp. CBS 109695]
MLLSCPASLTVKCVHCGDTKTASDLLQIASTSYADVFRGSTATCEHAGAYSLVFAKTFRIPPINKSDGNTKTIFDIIGDLSARVMSNEIIAPMPLGSITLGNMTIPAIVTPFYERGNVSVYVRQHPDVDKKELAWQIAVELEYVHSVGVIHGNLCVENVMITGTGKARIMDIGVDSLRRDMAIDGRCRVPSKWMYKASEELELGVRSTETDVHSFASTIYLIYTGQPMFPLRSASRWAHHLRQLIECGHIGIFGAHKPSGMGEDVWMLVSDCWARDPSSRVRLKHGSPLYKLVICLGC